MSDAVNLRPFEQDRFNNLIDLARTRFDAGVTGSEARVLLHSATPYNLPEPTGEQSRPNVRSEFLRWLMTDAEAAKFIDPTGIRVWSVTISAPLDLQGATIPHLVHLLWSDIQSEVALFNAEVRGLLIVGGNLRRGLHADGITVRGPLFIKGSECGGTIRLTGADIGRNVDMSGTALASSGLALVLDGARIRGSVFMHEGFRSSGEVRMLNARVGGDLAFAGATFTGTEKALSLDKVVVEGLLSLNPGGNADGSVKAFTSSGSVNLPAAEIRGDFVCNEADIGATGIALNLSTAKIGGHVYLRGFKARGSLNMHSAEVGNNIDMSGATLTEANFAVSLEGASVRGSVLVIEGFSSFGWIDLKGAHIGGNVVCDDCKLPVLYCANTTIKGDLQWTGIRDASVVTLSLNGATIKRLRDERESWPGFGRLRLDGLTYEDLTLHTARTSSNREKNEFGPEHPLKVIDRIEWLQRQPTSDQAEPQPWMQLAAVLRAKGNEDGAKRSIFELRRVQVQFRTLAVRTWKIGFARLQQTPLWIGFPIILTTCLATCLFWLASKHGAIAPTSKEAYVAWSTGSRMDAAYPRFNPFIYTLENDLPLVKFGLDDKWAPDQTYKPNGPIVCYQTLCWARIVLIFSGWFQATVLAAAIGSRFKN